MFQKLLKLKANILPHLITINEIESKYITTSDHNKFTKDIIDNSIKSKNLVTKTDYYAKLQGISKRITSNKP